MVENLLEGDPVRPIAPADNSTMKGTSSISQRGGMTR